MTKINRMVMHGFKSFAVRTELVFSDHFDCILGPNGSGKSNILDALCFVLGKSSAKGLRAEKSANLIYNGGKSKKPAKAGRVSIYFDNSEKEFPLEAKEIEITRIITQSGQSKYRINNMNSTRQQVLDLLSIARIDPDGYNIILQGDIVRFIEMTPMERRQVIEEISGISIYEDKKNKAMNELEKVEKRLSEVDIIMKERQVYLRELRKDRNQALKYKELNDKIRENKASYLKMSIDAKNKSIKDIESRQASIRKELEKKAAKVDSLKQSISEKKREVSEITQKVEEKGEAENLKLQKEIETLRVDVATNKTRISSCENELIRIGQKREQMTKSISEIDAKIEEINSQKAGLDKKKQSLAKEIGEIESKVRSFKKKHNIDDDTSEMDRQMEEIDQKSEELASNIQTLRDSQQNLLREKDKLEFQLKTVDEKISKVSEIEKTHKKELEQLKSKRDNFKAVTKKLNDALDRSSYLASSIGQAEKELLGEKEEYARLKVRDAEKREKAYASMAVRKILESKNRFGRVYGTVSGLGKVQSKYGLAIETAAGPRVNSVVVEDDAVASKCINYLRDNKLGVATFLPLNKIKGFRIPDSAKVLAKKTGVLGFAVDLVSYDKKYSNIFSYALKDTLVVDTLENARRIGVGAIRMVTLAGDLIEASGSMQGGFRQASKTSFQEKELDGKLHQAESRISELESRLSKLELERKKNESLIIQLREQKASLEGEIIKTEKGLHLGSDDLDASVKLKKSLESELASTDREIAGINSKITSLNKELAALKIKKQSIKERLNQIRNPLLLAELNTFSQRKEELSHEIMKIDSDIKSADIQINDIFKRDKDNTARILNDLDKEEKSFKDEKQLLAQKIKDQSKELKEMEQKQAKFYSKFKELFNRRSKLNDEISKAEDLAAKTEQDSRRDEHQINALSLDAAKLKGELAGLEDEFSQYEGVRLFLKKPVEELKKEIASFERMKEEIGTVNLRALDIYDKVEFEYKTLVQKQKSLFKEKEDVLKLMGEIESRKISIFNKTFDVVSSNFQKIFISLSTKGSAYLELENRENPFEGGLLIKVKLTGTRYLDIRALSGGEKTLTALAFIFSVQEHEPAHFYVLDEVDAALDKHNSEKFSKLIAKYAQNSQYIIISHNDMVISYADSLYGTSMDSHGITKVVSLKV